MAKAKKIKSTACTLEDLQDSESLSEAVGRAKEIVEHLGHAESCETMEDFLANLQNALDEIQILRDAISESME